MGDIHQGSEHRPGHALYTPFCNQPQVWLIVSFWLLRAPAGQLWYCSPHGRRVPPPVLRAPAGQLWYCSPHGRRVPPPVLRAPAGQLWYCSPHGRRVPPPVLKAFLTVG
ncbi:unnamed protein product, partial [Staurois parvus]